ncbi:hypothetical protein Drose_00395 [Dactylosporangium roseum]|uniref:Uncharacterized protein n=1 Tax=Dactylosporangium roseum TaxID=47989 RepID=A0ABY5Z5T5_9ACTN|nr:hypothetical protein [Dactylosporangium roseum]UWZ36847.1 hypothetical protein Drose_00395 [Dactylosporangium roseum]
MATPRGRGASMSLAIAVAALGVASTVSAWNAWDPLPPAGPPLSDSDRTYEILLGLCGLVMTAGGIWATGRIGRWTPRRR